MNETISRMVSHRSVRSYLDKPVAEEDLDQIIEAVQSAPNWVNMQHVSVIAIQDAERRKNFARLCGEQKHIAEAPVFLVFCADYYRTYLACRQHGQQFDNVMQDIDHVLVGSHEVGIALGTAVAAAESLGLGTVPIGDIRLHALEAVRGSNNRISRVGRNEDRNLKKNSLLILAVGVFGILNTDLLKVYNEAEIGIALFR